MQIQFILRIKAFLESIVHWLKSFYDWLAKARLFIFAIAVLFVAFFFGFWVYGTERAIRVSGLGLQLVGMWFAIRGVLGIRKYFKQPPLQLLIVNWFKQFPRWARSFTGDMQSTSYSRSHAQADLEIWANDDPNQTIEVRLTAVLQNMEQLKSDIKSNQKSTSQLASEFENHKRQASDANKQLENTMRKEIESSQTNDLLKSLVGMVLLTAGIVMSTISQEFILIINELH